MATVPRWKGRLNFKLHAHRAIRVQVFRRDDFTCQGCGYRPPDSMIPPDYDGRYTIGNYPWPMLQIDHVYPRAFGGLPVMDNLQTLCEHCNIRKWAKIPDVA